MHNYKNIPDLTDKIAIVTGANSGTGYGITYHLAKHNCKVIMASRNKEKLQKAKAELLKELPYAQLEIEVVDITDMMSIKDFCKRIKSKYSKIDFLANNAGGGSDKFKMTADGLETVLTVNYLGHFALTIQLLPVLKEQSRIVTFSSIGYKLFLENDLDVDNLMLTNKADFNSMQEYCKGKLCCILFSVKLQEEFKKIGSKSMSLACHPGWARTNLMMQEETNKDTHAQKVKMNEEARMRGDNHSLFDGALPAIEALIADDAKSGVVYSPKNDTSIPESVGEPIPREIDQSHYKKEDIDKLWIKSQELTKITVSEFL